VDTLSGLIEKLSAIKEPWKTLMVFSPCCTTGGGRREGGGREGGERARGSSRVNGH